MRPRFRLSTAEVAEAFPYGGKPAGDFEVLYPASLKAPREHSVMFAQKAPQGGAAGLELSNCIIFVLEDSVSLFADLKAANWVIPVAEPRLEFARLIQFAVARESDGRPYRTLANGAVLGQNVELGNDVQIEPLAFIDHDVRIGARTVIGSGAKIRRFVEIGEDAHIRENAVIGGLGFGFERDEEEVPVRLPHLGGVRIGDRVEVGALTTVVGGTIDPTIIEDDAKIDDHVHIAHNCIIRRGALVVACAEVSGSVEVQEFSWVGPNSSVLQGLQIGARSFVGLGAVVTKSVEPGAVVAGNPAAPTSQLRTFNEAKARLMKAVQEGRL